MASPPLVAPQFVDTKEAGRVLGIPASTLCTWRTRGGSPPFRRVGPGNRLVRYALADLIGWAESRPAMQSTSDVGPLVAA